ncbi:hypothetical protein [Lactobacillus gasseri]|uniref:hypothetical protein n=1 Tax=Lactobacillus gasseri TaxID=1596 RepID=UPI0022E181E8|nr:hypothetical protein [Lactobacillus gasseri]
MFLFTSKFFKYLYFLSALLPLNILIFIWFLLIEENSRNSTILFIELYFGISILIGIVSLICLIRQLDRLDLIIKHQGKEVVFIKDKYNVGVRDFLISTFLPILTSFSFKDNIIAAFIMVLLFQVFLLIFYLKSSDFMPNIILMIIGYNIFEGATENNKRVYCISKKVKIGTVIEKKVQAIKVGDSTEKGNVYWIVGE